MDGGVLSYPPLSEYPWNLWIVLYINHLNGKNQVVQIVALIVLFKSMTIIAGGGVTYKDAFIILEILTF